MLALETGYERDYAPGKPYGDYFASAELMFAVLVPDDRLAPKDYVFALRGEDDKAWPLEAFAGGRVINDADLDVVLIGDAATRSVRAYRAGGRRFEARSDAAVVGAATRWREKEPRRLAAGLELGNRPRRETNRWTVSKTRNPSRGAHRLPNN